MSSRVRRIAVGLATVMLLMSLFLAIEELLDPPEQALAACQVETGCYSPYFVTTGVCCSHIPQEWVIVQRVCWKINLDCSVDYWVEEIGHGCFGPWCLYDV